MLSQHSVPVCTATVLQEGWELLLLSLQQLLHSSSRGAACRVLQAHHHLCACHWLLLLVAQNHNLLWLGAAAA
jgi:hypothetical protein